MQPNIEIALATLALVRIVIGMDYQSTLMTQRITHFENPYIDFDLRFYGDEEYPFMILNDTITPYNDLHLLLYIRVYDQAPNFLANAPMSLCQLLYNESVSTDPMVSQYNIPQIFNLVGKTCPLDPASIRLYPYLFPPKFSTETKLDCGYNNVEALLMKCNEINEEGDIQCETLIKSVSMVLVVNDSCKDKSVDPSANQAYDADWMIQKRLFRS